MQNLNPIVTAAMQSQQARLARQAQSSSPTQPSSAFSANQSGTMRSPQSMSSTTLRSETTTPLNTNLQSPTSEPGGLARVRSDENYRAGGPVRVDVGTSHPRSNTFSSTAQFGTQPPVGPSYGMRNSPHLSSTMSSQPYSQSGPSSSNYVPHQSFPPMTPLPPPTFVTMSQPPSSEGGNAFTTAAQDGLQSAADGNFMEGMTPQYSIPMFGGDGYSRSPFAMADDFTAWLFNESQLGSGTSAMSYHGPGEMSGVMGNAQNFSLQAPFFTHDPFVSGHFQQPAPPPTHPMAVHSLIDTHMQQMAISDERRKGLIDLIETRFNDTSHAPVKKKVELLEGNLDDDRHVLSLH